MASNERRSAISREADNRIARSIADLEASLEPREAKPMLNSEEREIVELVRRLVASGDSVYTVRSAQLLAIIDRLTTTTQPTKGHMQDSDAVKEAAWRAKNAEQTWNALTDSDRATLAEWFRGGTVNGVKLNDALLRLTTTPSAPRQEEQGYARWVERASRFEDMSPDGQLILHRQQDGDVIVCMWTKDAGYTQVEFCAIGSGGGRSPRTLRALTNLMVAMEQDNAETPISPVPLASQQPTGSDEYATTDGPCHENMNL